MTSTTSRLLAKRFNFSKLCSTIASANKNNMILNIHPCSCSQRHYIFFFIIKSWNCVINLYVMWFYETKFNAGENGKCVWNEIYYFMNFYGPYQFRSCVSLILHQCPSVCLFCCLFGFAPVCHRIGASQRMIPSFRWWLLVNFRRTFKVNMTKNWVPYTYLYCTTSGITSKLIYIIDRLIGW